MRSPHWGWVLGASQQGAVSVTEHHGVLAMEGPCSGTGILCALRAEARDDLRLLAHGVAGTVCEHRHDHQAGRGGQGKRGWRVGWRQDGPHG